MQHLLFVYGTLLLADNDFANHLKQHARFIEQGKVKGILYDIGEYPGMIKNPAVESWVDGSIYSVDDNTLKLIDDYEGYGNGQDEPYLYLREKHNITTINGLTEAWVYIYNHDTTGLPIIPSGNYSEYLKQKKSRDA